MISRPLTPAGREKVVAALNSGSIVEAIRLYRLDTLCNLSDAKAAVEAMRISASSPQRVVIPSGDDPVLQAIYQGRKIEAIKQYRLKHQVDLRTAKDAVEAIEADARQSSPGAFLSKPQPTAGRGCLGWIVFLVLAVVMYALLHSHAMHR